MSWDADTGAEQLDALLIQHFASEFRQKHGKDLLKSPKAVAKLRRQVGDAWHAPLWGGCCQGSAAALEWHAAGLAGTEVWCTPAALLMCVLAVQMAVSWPTAV